MCGIVGFNRKPSGSPDPSGRSFKLEYRGYDSAGLAVRDGSAEVEGDQSEGKTEGS